jgi:hypothetical protein
MVQQSGQCSDDLLNSALVVQGDGLNAVSSNGEVAGFQQIREELILYLN